MVASQANAAVFYVATTGDDARSCATAQNIATPKRTIRNAVGCLGPGHTLLIRGGVYPESLNEYETNVPSGSSWDPAGMVRIAGYPGERAVMKPNAGASEVLRIMNDAVDTMGTHHVEFDNLVLDGNGVVTNVVKLTYMGTDPARAAHHIRIKNSELMNSPGQGILGGTQSEFINLKIHDNGSTDFDHGIYTGGHYNLIEGCEIYRNSGWGIHKYSTGDYNIIRNNKIYNNARIGKRGPGIGLYGGKGNLVYNNLIWGNNSAIQLDYGESGARILNNTMFANKTGGAVYNGAGSASAVFKNNIMFQNGGGIIDVGPGAVKANNIIDVDPKFVNAAGFDFRLLDGSPAINAGLNLTADGVTKDFAGSPRPAPPAPFEIGAFEYGAASPAPPPPPPPPASPPSAGPVAMWKLDEASGQTLLDSAGSNSGLLGSSSAAEASDPSRALGRVNGALRFDGVDDRATIALSSMTQNLSAFTVAAWINPSGWGGAGYGRIFSRESASGFDDFYLLVNTHSGNTLSASIVNGAGTETGSGAGAAAIALNAWQHVAATYNDAGDRRIRLFINGVEAAYQSQTPLAGTLKLTANPILLGNRPAGDRAFSGLIDDVRVYNRTLSGAEIQALFNAGTPNVFDLNGDGSTTVTDIQIAVNQALNASSCSTGDVNKDGACNISDVQLLINRALGV